MTLPTGVVIRTSPRWDNQVRHLGYEPVGKNAQDSHTGLPTDIELIRASQEQLSKVKIVPAQNLSQCKQAHLKLAREIAYGRNGTRPPKDIHAAIIPPASDRVRTAGMYSRASQEIYISLDQLEHGRTTVDTVIHEIAHHASGAEDGEEAHNAAMTKVAAGVIERTASGQFDELLKEVVW